MSRQRSAQQDIPATALHYVYLLCCRDGSYYCGYSSDLLHRLKMHQSGQGARYTKSRRPVCLVYHEVFLDQRSAMQREYAIKQISRAQKEELIRSQSVCLTVMQPVFQPSDGQDKRNAKGRRKAGSKKEANTHLTKDKTQSACPDSRKEEPRSDRADSQAVRKTDPPGTKQNSVHFVSDEELVKTADRLLEAYRADFEKMAK